MSGHAPADRRSVMEACRGLVQELGLDVDDERLAALAAPLIASRSGLLRMREQALDFGPFAVEPAAAQEWLEEMGLKRLAG